MRIAALIISMIALCFALLSFLHNDYTHINHDTKHYQTHSPDALPETCIIQGKAHPIASKECADQARYRESHNLSKNDFIAQKNMALYALLGLIVGSVGLCIVGLTLNETRKAAQAANATLNLAKVASSLEQRAYIDVEIVHYGSQIDNPPTAGDFLPEISNGLGRIQLNFRVRNTGNMPSTKCWVFYQAKASYMTPDNAPHAQGDYGDFRRIEPGYIGANSHIDKGHSVDWPIYGNPAPHPVMNGRILAHLNVRTLVLFQDGYGEEMEKPFRAVLQVWTGVTAFNSKLVSKSGQIFEVQNENQDEVQERFG